MNEPNYDYLKTYLGAPEIRPLWENLPEKLAGAFNVQIGVMSKSGPFLEEDVARIAQALKDHGFRSREFDRVVVEVHENILNRNPIYRLHCAWEKAFRQSDEEYEDWYNALSAEEQALVNTWEENYFLAKYGKTPGE